jgi:two-component system response regulator
VSTHNTPVPFLLIAEDNPDDRLLLEYAFRSARLSNPRQIVNNGAEAITWLSQTLTQPGPLCQRPDLVVLDIQMPYKDGFEVLQWIREQPAFNELPVVIMSGLQSPDSVARAKALGAHSYFFKPGDYSELTRFIYNFNFIHARQQVA